MLSKANLVLLPGLITSSLDKSIKIWDIRTGFSEQVANIADSLPWDVKLWNGEKDIVVGCENGEIGIMNLEN